MENIKGCKDCKHSKRGNVYILCTHPKIANLYSSFDSDTGLCKEIVTIKIASDARSTFNGKCKREAIYFEPTRYYKFKQWLKQLLK